MAKYRSKNTLTNCILVVAIILCITFIGAIGSKLFAVEKGPSITKKKEVNFETIETVARLGGGQDGAIYNDYLFSFNSSGGVTVYSMKDYTSVSSFTLDKNDVISPHANSVCFSDTYYAEGDEFPLMYVNIYNTYASAADRLLGTCNVYRLTRDGTVFTTELVQIIKVGFTEDTDLWSSVGGDTRPYGNFVVDTDDDKLYAFTMRDGTKKTRFFKFDLPDVTAGDLSAYGVNVVVLTVDDIEDQFDVEYFNYLQGCCYWNGKIYSSEGFGASAPNIATIREVDLKTHEVKTINLVETYGISVEPEFLYFYNDSLYYKDASGNLYKFNTYTVEYQN